LRKFLKAGAGPRDPMIDFPVAGPLICGFYIEFLLSW
jgi:hypothetical protein